MDKASLIEKIRKILSKTEERGATPAEAATALAVAQKLMAENGLFMTDIESQPDEVIELSDSYGTKSVSHYQWVLASELAKHFACQVVVRHKVTCQELTFIGEQVRVEAFKECFLFAYKAYQKSYNIYAKRKDSEVNNVLNQLFLGVKHNPTRDEKLQQRWNYFMGFVSGLTNELIRSENENALVIVESPALTDYMEKLRIKHTRVNYRQAQYGDARDEGYKDGAFAFRNKNKALNNE